MNQFDMSALTFNQINIFLHAAKLRSFSEAANELHITQPLVSRTIANLEKQFGFPLFIRGHHFVALTPCGSLLADKWDSLYAEAVSSVEDVCSLYASEENTLNVTDDYMQITSTYLTAIIDVFKSSYPEIKLHVEKMRPPDFTRSLLAGTSDIGFISDPELARLQHENYSYKKLAEGTFCLIVSQNHPYADHTSVTIDELADIPIAIIEKKTSSAYYDTIVSLFTAKGYMPRIGSYVTNTPSLMYACKNEGFGMIAHGFISREPDMRYIPITGTSCSMYLLWKSGNNKKGLDMFIETASHVMQSFDPTL